MQYLRRWIRHTRRAYRCAGSTADHRKCDCARRRDQAKRRQVFGSVYFNYLKPVLGAGAPDIGRYHAMDASNQRWGRGRPTLVGTTLSMRKTSVGGRGARHWEVPCDVCMKPVLGAWAPDAGRYHAMYGRNQFRGARALDAGWYHSVVA